MESSAHKPFSQSERERLEQLELENEMATKPRDIYETFTSKENGNTKEEQNI